MHLIAIRNLRIDANTYPDAIKSINQWYATVKKSKWQNLEDVRRVYSFNVFVIVKFIITGFLLSIIWHSLVKLGGVNVFLRRSKILQILEDSDGDAD